MTKSKAMEYALRKVEGATDDEAENAKTLGFGEAPTPYDIVKDHVNTVFKPRSAIECFIAKYKETSE